MNNFNGKTAVITGAASGIGLALAKHAGAMGMNLVLADIDEQQDLSAVYHLGDLVGYAPWPNEVIALLRDRGIASYRAIADQVRAVTEQVSVAHMRSPAGWEEPAQRPEFDEVTTTRP